ncbi:hypothetical protein ACFLYR_01755 [Chloroflexota bacterium]
MKKWALLFREKYLNGGTALVLMGIQWLYLWLFPWYGNYVADPHWGHNYTQAMAFLVVGLAYYHRRVLLVIIAFLASVLVIPASLELVPTRFTIFAAAALLALVIIDMIAERGRQRDLLQPSGAPLTFWLKRHLPRFSYIMLAHISLIYFLVRVPSGTWETDWSTRIFDALLVPFIVLLLLEDMPGITNATWMKRISFFWGMAVMLVAFIILYSHPEILPTVAITLVITVFGIFAMVTGRRTAK